MRLNILLHGVVLSVSAIVNVLFLGSNLRNNASVDTVQIAPATMFTFVPNSFFIDHKSLSTPVPVVPVRLTIPKIHVDAAVEQVGLTPAGAMDVPKDPKNVAWFNLGPLPGERGGAVIAGHYGRTNDQASVFDDLYKLRKGDVVSVLDSAGGAVSFVVREIRRYGPADVVPGVFDSHDGKAHLNLVTCEGAWDALTNSYPKRLVVFTDRQDG